MIKLTKRQTLAALLAIFTRIMTVLFLVVTFAGNSSGQTKDTLIQYKGGFERLGRDILFHLPINPSIAADHDAGVNYDRYYNVVLEISKNGTIGESIFVFSLRDSLKAPLIINALKFTAGKWINNSGVDQTVVLPLYLRYARDGQKDSDEKIPVIRTESYWNGNKRAVVYLDPVVLTSSPPVR